MLKSKTVAAQQKFWCAVFHQSMLTVKTYIAILVGILAIQTAGMTKNIFNGFFVHCVFKRT